MHFIGDPVKCDLLQTARKRLPHNMQATLTKSVACHAPPRKMSEKLSSPLKYIWKALSLSSNEWDRVGREHLGVVILMEPKGEGGKTILD